MKILITGNMGYVGPVMTRHFQKSFVEPALIGLDTGFFAHCLTGAKLMPEILLDQQWFKDVREVAPNDLEGFDAVVHLAAISNDPMGKAFEAVTADINQHASVRLAAAAKKAGVRSFVFASSCSVYGYAEGAARDENSELHPLTEYARSKIGTEAEIEGLADDSFVVTCLRFPTACGMSDRLRLDLVLNDFVASAVATGKIQILSDGSPWRPLIDVKDMSRAAEWAVKRDLDSGGPFLSVNAGRTEWNYQIRDLAEAVSKEMNGIEIDINKNAAPDKRSYRVDFSLYESLAPNHLPQIGLAQSIRELKFGLESMDFGDADFRTSNLIRLKMLEQHRKSGRLDESLRAKV
ncbi:MAG: NAD-dependent epimerase [Woeseia sp.]|nr:NAD-dependent epimerase [Woeseia sp.]|tara:strand:- start:4697 stop:5743 length:1047 start_codon:yes stop_codon:yes gene_type:complete